MLTIKVETDQITQMPTEDATAVKTGWMTEDELAAWLGIVCKVVARSLRTLERIGAIRMNRRQVIVVNKARLLESVQGPWN